MDQQQPKIPTLKDSQKPQVKLRGLGAGLTLFDRLKQFKKKDLAFILAGLATLFMAPLAEHFMMSPESGDSVMKPGFGPGAGGAAGGVFGQNGNLSFERGDGLAPGGPTGGGSDIITPLNVRDPSALVMGPGATQQPPTSSVAPQTPPPTAPVARNESDLKDALAASARGVSAAAKKALLPVPKVALGGSGLRGLGAVGGGSSASAGLSAPNSSGLAPNRASTGGGLSNVRSAPGYKGLAARGPGSGGSGIEALKAAADRAGSSFNRTGSGSTDLNNAASQGIPTGGGSFGGMGQGGASANDKGFGGNQNKDGKNQGESLAFMKAKMDMEKAEELKWKKKEAADTELQMLQWRNKIGEAVAGKLGEGLGGKVSACLFKGFKNKDCMGSGTTTNYTCSTLPNWTAQMGPYIHFTDGDLAQVGDNANQKDGKGGTYMLTDGGNVSGLVNGNWTPVGTNCADDATGAGTKGKNQPAPNGAGSLAGVQTDTQGLDTLCTAIETLHSDATPGVPAYYTAMRNQAAELAGARQALFGVARGACTGTPTQTYTMAGFNSAVDALNQSKTLTVGTGDQDSSAAIPVMKAAVGKKAEELGDPLPGKTQLDQAVAKREAANTITTQAGTAISGITPTTIAIPAAWSGDVTKANALGYRTQLNDIKGQMLAYQSKVSGVVGALKADHDLLGLVVNNGAGPGGGQIQGPTLKRAGQATSDWTAAQQNFQTHQGDAVALPGHQAAPADAVATDAAITAAQDSVTNADPAKGAKAAVDAYVAETDQTQKATKKEAAKNALTASATAVVKAQDSQTGWLGAVATDVRGQDTGTPAR